MPLEAHEGVEEGALIDLVGAAQVEGDLPGARAHRDDEGPPEEDVEHVSVEPPHGAGEDRSPRDLEDREPLPKPPAASALEAGGRADGVSVGGDPHEALDPRPERLSLRGEPREGGDDVDLQDCLRRGAAGFAEAPGMKRDQALELFQIGLASLEELGPGVEDRGFERDAGGIEGRPPGGREGGEGRAAHPAEDAAGSLGWPASRSVARRGQREAHASSALTRAGGWRSMPRMARRFLFLMDPIGAIDIDADSTFVLMLESQERGHEVLYAQPKDLRQHGAEPWVTACPVELRRVRSDHARLGEPQDLRLSDCDAVFMRKDPPFDLDFLVATYILERADRRSTVMVNEPQALRDFNEKLAALRWPELMPPTVVAADRKAIRNFIEEHGEAVVKPLSAAGGYGIFHLRAGDKNTGSALDLLTLEGRRHIEVQAFLRDVVKGDKRVLLLDGEPIGAVNRVPASDDIRANMHVGGKAEKSPITERDREIAAALAPELKRRGLLFVGIDVIGGYLTEVNVTSPTGLQEANRFDGVKLERLIIDRVEARRDALG